MSESIKKLTSLKQSLWYDNIQRNLLESGELKAMIERGDIRGVTSNPTIFQNAIAKTNDYDSALIPLAWAGWDAEKIFWQLAIEDIQQACDLFRPLYDETRCGDGYVSLEVSPYLANDTERTIDQARELWERVDRPNLMIKIPATKAGIPAIRATIAAGINVNVTLIFSLARYAEVMEAYLAGLEDRVAKNKSVESISSVASFFVSRLDTKIDPLLASIRNADELKGKAAIANAKLAYHAFEEFFTSARFHQIKTRFRARIQRPLWASTGTKNPNYSDTLYVDNLIGPDTVNTVPPATLDAFRDHGKPGLTLTRGFEECKGQIAQIEALGISMDQVTLELEDEGVKAFESAFVTLLQAIEGRRESSASSLDFLSGSIAMRLAQLESDSVPARVWSHDPTLWTDDPAEQTEVTKRLGWLHSLEDARARLDGYLSFAKEIHDEGIDRALVIGMGGSSLTAEVFSSLLAGANIEARLSLAILDSTDPQQVKLTFEQYPPDKSLYIVASKSGGTAELMAAFDYVWKLSNRNGSRFVAITDAGTSLEILAKERGFRKIFNADPNVGGRFSALTDFGLIPAALLGMDLQKLLGHIVPIESPGGEDVSVYSIGFVLGALIAEAALAGRDKLTIVADTPVSALAGWIEQVVAESSGKHGKGILPVALEPLDAPEAYGDDRFFVYLRQTGELNSEISALKNAGFPVIEFPITSPYEAGAEFFRWEIAIAIACHILGVNAFDQPDVQDSKLRTIAKIKDFQATGKLADVDLIEMQNARSALNDFLAQAGAGNYVAINAYIPRNQEMIQSLQLLRAAIRKRTKCAVTAGFGPRFQHSTGQFHKGGPNKGLFIQVVYDAAEDMEIPTQGLTFGALIRAQALGDYEALVAAGRMVVRIKLDKLEDLRKLM
jgi:transaldolase/glucose-6-phosphate isomerase